MVTVRPNQSERTTDVATLVRLISSIPDPEIPVITIEDLGILRGVVVDGTTATVTITPTYSGCPAMDQIRTDIESVGAEAGFATSVETVFSPAWTTDWMSAGAKTRLREFGIAPPTGLTDEPRVPVLCPRCAGASTIISRFGSTACKALLVCDSCSEPFSYFKVH